MSALEDLVRIMSYSDSAVLDEMFDYNKNIGACAKELLEKHTHELAEKVRQGGVHYDLREFNAARAVGPGRVLEFIQSAIADSMEPEAS
jgi:hypothetical protein